MATYSGTYATPRLDLGVALMEYNLGSANYIATQALPVFNTPIKAGSFTAMNRENILRTPSIYRAAGGNYNRDEIQGEDYTFSCQEYGREELVDDGQRRMYASDFDAELIAAQVGQGVLMRAQELRAAALLFNTTTFPLSGTTGYDYSSSAPWTTTSSDVMSQINVAKGYIRGNVGMEANTIIMNATNLDRLLNNDDMLGRFAYSQTAYMSALVANVGALLGLNVLIGNAYYNTANLGIAYSGSAIWSNLYVMVAVVPQSASLAEPGLGRTFVWTADSPSNTVVETYRDETRRADVVRVRHHVQEKILDSGCGVLLKVATA